MKSVALLIAAASCLALGACAHDDEVGHSKSTTKQEVRTPEGKTTVTETRTKDTTVIPK
jgi:hypothetical protein